MTLLSCSSELGKCQNGASFNRRVFSVLLVLNLLILKGYPSLYHSTLLRKLGWALEIARQALNQWKTYTFNLPFLCQCSSMSQLVIRVLVLTRVDVVMTLRVPHDQMSLEKGFLYSCTGLTAIDTHSQWIVSRWIDPISSRTEHCMLWHLFKSGCLRWFPFLSIAPAALEKK